MKKYIYDGRDIQVADDGNTSYYGGTCEFNGKTIYCQGTDRDGGYLHDLAELVQQETQLPKDSVDLENLLCALDSGYDTLKGIVIDGETITIYDDLSITEQLTKFAN